MSETAIESDRTLPLRRFLFVLPLAFITYGLAYLDRVNFGQAESRLRKTLDVSAEKSALISACFFLGYFFFQIPGAHFASRRSVRRLIFWALILWGILSALTGVIRSVSWLIADRLALGAVEGVVLPAMLIFLTRWFSRSERSRANALLMLANPITMAVSSVLCGFLIQYFDAHPMRGLGGWQMMFIMEGLPSIVWAFAWLMLARERPAEADWMPPESAAAVQAVLDSEQQDIARVKNYAAAFTDGRVIVLSLMFLCLSASSYGLMMWLPQIVEEASRKGVARAGMLTSLPYLGAVFSMIVLSYASDKTLQRKPFVVGSLLTGCAAFVVTFLVGPSHFWIWFMGLMVVGTCIYTPVPPLWAWMTEMLPRNVAGESMAMVNSVGALGGFIGTLMVGILKNHFHSTGPAFVFQACCFLTAGLLALCVPARSKARGPHGFETVQPIPLAQRSDE